MIEVPPHLVAATRLGVAKEAGQVLVVVLDKKAKRRSLWLADDRGMRPCRKRYVYKEEAQSDASPFASLTRVTIQPLRPLHRQAVPIQNEHHYEVVEHLGNEDEHVRCVALLEAERLGVPVLDWPVEASPNVVTWAPGLWALHEG